MNDLMKKVVRVLRKLEHVANEYGFMISYSAIKNDIINAVIGDYYFYYTNTILTVSKSGRAFMLLSIDDESLGMPITFRINHSTVLIYNKEKEEFFINAGKDLYPIQEAIVSDETHFQASTLFHLNSLQNTTETYELSKVLVDMKCKLLCGVNIDSLKEVPFNEYIKHCNSAIDSIKRSYDD